MKTETAQSHEDKSGKGLRTTISQLSNLRFAPEYPSDKDAY